MTRMRSQARPLEAKAFMQGQVTNDVESLAAGGGCYAAFLTPKGKMLGDLRILDTGEELLLDTERLALQALFNMIRRFSIGYQAENSELGNGLAVIPRQPVKDVGVCQVAPKSPDVEACVAGNLLHHCRIVDVEPVAMSSLQQRHVQVVEAALPLCGFRSREGESPLHVVRDGRTPNRPAVIL